MQAVDTHEKQHPGYVALKVWPWWPCLNKCVGEDSFEFLFQTM
jgi:hypothetical protein